MDGHKPTESGGLPAVAEDLPGDVRDILNQFRPDLADNIERMQSIKRAHHAPDATPQDKLADDYGWLWEFEHEGDHLTAKQIRFLVAFAGTGFKTLIPALQMAGYTNERSWAKPVVMAALHEMTKANVKRWEISGYKIARELSSILNGNITDFCDISAAGIVMKDLAALPKEMTACIQEVQETRNAQGTQLRIKLYDKMAAINTGAKLLDLMPKEKIELTITGLEDRLASAMQRLRHEPQDIEGELVKDV